MQARSRLTVWLYAFIVLSLVFVSISYADTTEHILEGNFPPLRLTYDDLARGLGDICHLIIMATGEDETRKCGPLTLTYRIESEKISIRTDDLAKLLMSDALPSKATGFEFIGLGRRSSVSLIRIKLSEFTRWTIQGTDRVLLEALRGQIESFSAEHQTWFSGTPVQLLLFLSPVMLFALVFFLFSEFRGGDFYFTRPRLVLIILSGIVLAGFWLYIGATDRPKHWFPRIAIYSGSASFLQRYSAELSFWLGVISIGLGIPTILRRSRKK